MSLAWVIIGTFFQLGLAFMLFMLAAFAGGGVANGRKLTSLQSKMLDLSIYALPLISLISAGIIIYQYNHDGSSTSYWWHIMPIVAAVIYLVWIGKVGVKKT